MYDADYEWLMIDAAMLKCITMQLEPRSVTRQWDAQKGAQHKDTSGRGCSWFAGAIFCHDATVADCSVAETLIANFQAEYLLADRGYDTDAIIGCALQVGMTPVIPQKKNRKVLRDYDKYLYKLRHLVENAFLHLKKWRGIVTHSLC